MYLLMYNLMNNDTVDEIFSVGAQDVYDGIKLLKKSLLYWYSLPTHTKNTRTKRNSDLKQEDETLAALVH